VPAAAVIPAPMAYVKIAVVKKLVVECVGNRAGPNKIFFFLGGILRRLHLTGAADSSVEAGRGPLRWVSVVVEGGRRAAGLRSCPSRRSDQAAAVP